MTRTLRVTSIFIIVVTFSSCTEIVSNRTTESDAEEKEKIKPDIIFGNISIGNMEAITKDSNSLAMHVDDLWNSNSSDYESVPESQTDSTTENSLERDENENSESSQSITNSDENSEELSFVYNTTASSLAITFGIEDLVSNVSCPFGARKCKSANSELDLKLKDNILPTGTLAPSSSVWNVVKSLMSLREDFTRLKTMRVTSSRRLLISPTVTLKSSAETLENVIAIDTTEISKEAVNDKAKLTKPDDYVEFLDERLQKTNIKVVPTPLYFPLSSPSIEDTQIISSSLYPNLEDVTSSTTSNINHDEPTISSVFHNKPSKNYVYQPHLVNGKLEETHSSLETNKINGDLQSLPNVFPTILLNANNNNPTDDISEIEKNTSTFSLVLSSSFKKLETIVTSTEKSLNSTVSVALKPTPSPILDSTTPTMELKFVKNPMIKDDSPDAPATPPPPRVTNPPCSSLPVCVSVTLMQTTWEQFCARTHDFQDFLSKAVSQYTRPVQAHHIVLDAEVCLKTRPLQSGSDVSVAFYVTDESGEYEERLTEICGLVLRKWAPNSYRGSVLEVKLHTGELHSTALPVIPEMNSGFVAAVVISAVAGVALCLLCILLLVMRQKLALQSQSPDTATPSGQDAYSLDSLSISASFRRRRHRRSYLNHAFTDQEIPSRPLNAKSIMSCLKNKDLLEDEFRKIPMNMPKLDSIPEGAHVKNRYSNILPRPESRVALSSSGDDLKNYINANFVKGHGGKSSFYIACQAPLPEGVEDFWRMVWEQQSKVVIMLTMFEENGVSRCANYLPQSTLITLPPFGDFQVTLQKKDVYEFYTVSSLRLLELEKNLFRDVTHLWYTSWPDVGVPKDPSTLITFVQQCRSHMNRNSGPTIVHCSTGTGRTGVLLALDKCMREYEESSSLDVLQCVSQLRRDRAGAVQNKDQYILIHEAMLDFVVKSGSQSQRPSISSSKIS